MSNLIYVFGSNLAGRHGKGSALTAKTVYGAVYGVGKGRTGNSYAIPTKDEWLRPLPLSTIRGHIIDFIEYAKSHPELTFRVVEIGCMNAGYSPSQIAPLLSSAPTNCILPEGWRGFYSPEYDYRVVDDF